MKTYIKILNELETKLNENFNEFKILTSDRHQGHAALESSSINRIKELSDILLSLIETTTITSVQITSYLNEIDNEEATFEEIDILINKSISVSTLLLNISKYSNNLV